MSVEVWTDGCCLLNPGGPGGWAAVIVGDLQRELWGSSSATTNNRMELAAAIEGLRALGDGSAPMVCSDSRYVVDGATAWMHRWAARDWTLGRKRGRAGIANLSLWQMLYAEVVRTAASFRWVPGHAGHEHNERADALAGWAAKGRMRAAA